MILPMASPLVSSAKPSKLNILNRLNVSTLSSMIGLTFLGDQDMFCDGDLGDVGVEGLLEFGLLYTSGASALSWRLNVHGGSLFLFLWAI
jgi:hypothetical protein